MTGFGDWLPLADADPVPGDPAALRELAHRHESAAALVGQQVQALRRVGLADQWQGAAAQAYAARAASVPRDLDAAAVRLRRVAGALREFAPALEAAQRQARAALAHARDAQLRAGVVPGSPASRLPILVPGVLEPGERALHESLERARRLLESAVEQRDRAAARCARALAAAADDRLRNPHGWRRVLSAASRAAGLLSTWLGVAALVLCWVPGLGQVLGAAALTAGALALVADLALVGTDERTSTDLLNDVVGIVPAGRVARFGALLRPGAPLLAALARGAIDGRPTLAARAGVAELAVAVRSGRRARSWPAFLRSPGGIVDEIARARRLTRGGQVVVAGGHAFDLGQAAYGVSIQVRPAHRAERSR